VAELARSSGEELRGVMNLRQTMAFYQANGARWR
jgi:hypothetical protein